MLDAIFFKVLLLQLSNSIALAMRGNCDFIDKAKFAQSAGAEGLMVINDDEGFKSSIRTYMFWAVCASFKIKYVFFFFVIAELHEMVCTGNESVISIAIPVIMIPKSAGDNIIKSLAYGGRSKLYHKSTM